MKKSVSLILAVLLLVGLASVASADKLGLGLFTEVEIPYYAPKDNPFGQVNVTVCSLLLDDAGVIKAVRFDVQQANVVFCGDGGLETPEGGYRTKVELGDEYGMRKASPIGKEWFEQAEAFEAYCVGKTVADVLAQFSEDADVKSSVTMEMEAFLGALERAGANAK